jgi:hypothetical protein
VDVDSVLVQQDGVVRRAQALDGGMAPHDIRRMIRRNEWAIVHPGVYVDHTGPLPWLQRAWAGVLSVWPAALCGESALRAVEGPGRRDRDQTIQVVVEHHRRVTAPTGVRLRHSGRLDERVLWNAGPPRLRYEEAALDVAIEAVREFDAIAVLADAVQSRRTTARHLVQSLASRDRVPRRAWLESVLTDIADGTCSVLEHSYLARVERAHGLPRAQRQVAAPYASRMAYRDAEYGSLIVELDGRLFHNTAGQRDKDFERDLDAAVDGRDTRRLSWGQVFDRPCSTAGKIGKLLQSRGWAGEPQPCGPGCRLRV